MARHNPAMAISPTELTGTGLSIVAASESEAKPISLFDTMTGLEIDLYAEDSEHLPIIGMTSEEIAGPNGAWFPFVASQNREYAEAIIDAGGAPIIFPQTLNLSVLRTMYETASGLLLPGGYDINSQLYGQRPLATSDKPQEVQDAQEIILLEQALEDKKPVLAICRGMHLLNTVLGGTISQHLAVESEAQNHNISTTSGDSEHVAHELSLEPSSKLAQLLGTAAIKANSRHHQGIKNLAPTLRAVAWSEDGLIEAVESRDDRYIIGIQSHPESLQARAETRWQKLFTAFVMAASQYSLLR